MISRRSALRTVAAAAATAPAVAHLAQAQAAPAPAAPAAAPSGPYQLPPLTYAVDALEPFIDAKTMEIHHDRHHATYVASLNKAVAEHSALHSKSPEELIGMIPSLPESIRTAVRNHGGGHVNHSLFWQTLRRNGGTPPSGALMEALVRRFGTFEAFKADFTKAAMTVFGSGWAWLSLDPKSGELALESVPNQDNPYMAGRIPLLGLDVWEHAYYLKYQNRRADYVAAFFNLIHWDFVAARLAKKA